MRTCHFRLRADTATLCQSKTGDVTASLRLVNCPDCLEKLSTPVRTDIERCQRDAVTKRYGKFQGRASVWMVGGEYITLFPDGTSQVALDRNQAVRQLRGYFKQTLGNADYGVGYVDWHVASEA